MKLLRLLAVVALVCLPMFAQNSLCTRSVMCDDALPPNVFNWATGNDGISHKWGDFLPECMDPKFKGPISVIGLGACDMPDAPQPQPVKAVAPRAKFLSYRKSWQDAPLRTNKQVLSDWTFLVPVGSCAAAMTTDVLVTHGAREQFHSEAPVVLAIAGFSFISHKYLWAPFTGGMTSYCVQHYVRDAMQ